MVCIFNAFPCVRLGKPPLHPLPQATSVWQQQHSIFKRSRIMKEKTIKERLARGIPWVHLFSWSMSYQHLYWCCCSLDGVHQTNTLLQLRQSEYGLLALEMLGTTYSGAGVLFLLYLEQDRTSVKYFGAGVRESRKTQQFWKKFWNGNTLLSSPSGEETQNHPFLAGRTGECMFRGL